MFYINIQENSTNSQPKEHKAEYDAEMEKYTAHKPEYHMDEDESSTAAIRSAVFGEAE